MSEFLDELARTLAKPMPRSRAVRTLGAAVVTAAVGGSVRSTAGRASPRGRAQCPPAPTCDRKPGTSFCGTPNIGNDGCTRYIYVCCPNSGPDPAPVCCTRKGEVQCCRPCQKCGEEKLPGGSVNIICVGEPCRLKRCGPDITDALGDALSRVKSTFARWSSSVRADACQNLILIPWGTFSWDISQLSPSGRKRFSDAYGPECTSCGHSVQIGGNCHFDGSVNYVVYGTMMRLCRDHYRAEGSSWAGWHSEDMMALFIAGHKSFTGRVSANVRASAEWASAGFGGWPDKGPTPPGDRPDCTADCPKAFSGPGLTVQWYPHVIRP